MTIMELNTFEEEKSFSTEIENSEKDQDQDQDQDENLSDWNTSTEGKFFMKKAMELQEILNGILNQLSYTELMTCRLVNNRWRRLASKILLARNCTQVSIECYWQEEDTRSKGTCISLPFQGPPPQRWKICFIGKHGLVRTVNQYMGQRIKSDYPFDMEIFCLEALTDILERDKANIFPCTTFNFWDADLNHSEIKYFFQIQGKHIKTLRLISANPDSPFDKVQIQCKQPKKDFQLEFPALHYLAWTDWDRNSVLKVLKAAPNLKISALPNDDVTCLNEILMVKNVAIVKRLKVKLSTETLLTNCNGYAQNIKKFAKAGPSLCQLEFESSDITPKKIQEMKPGELKLRNKLKDSCIALLESTKDSLKKLILNDFCAQFELNELPKFSNLSHLSLMINLDGFEHSLLPPAIDLKTTFSKVETLELKVEEFDEDDDEQLKRIEWNSNFPMGKQFRGHFENVQRLEIDALLCRKEWLTNIKEKLCPNFDTVHLHNCTKNNLEICLPKIFEIWTHLRVLKLHFAIGEELPPLDESLVSLPNGHLMENGNTNHDHHLIEKSQKAKRPSVCDLKELKTIEIWTGKPNFDDELPLSQSSLLCISNLMPELKIGVYVRKNSSTGEQDEFLVD